MKKLLSFLVAVVMVLSVVPMALAANESAPDLSGTTIRILSEDCFTSNASWANILPVYKKVEADTGVKLDWEIITADYNSIMLTRLAGGTDCPDIIQLNTDAATWAKLIDDGVLVNISELMDEYAPNLAKFFKEGRPDVAGCMTYTDGNIYTIPDASYATLDDFYGKIANNGDNILMYRADLCEKLGIAEPTTIDELHAMLLAFKQADSNIIPMHMWDYSCWQSIRVFANCYGLQWTNPNTGSSFFKADDEGNLSFTAISEEARQWATEMHKWSEEGLLSTTVNAEDKMGLPGTGKVGVCYVGNYGSMQELNKLLAENGVEGAYFKALPWIKGPEGEYGIGTRSTFENAIGIVNNGNDEQIKKVLQYVDFTYFTEDGIVSQAMGEKGVNWDYGADGKPEFIGSTLKDWYIDKTSSLQAVGGNGHCRMPQVYRIDLQNIVSNAQIELGVKQPKGEEELAVCKAWSDAAFLSFPFMFYTAEEQEVINDVYSDLSTYVETMLNSFVLGEQDLAEWDAFVANVQGMGIDKVLAAYQSAYNRYLGK